MVRRGVSCYTHKINGAETNIETMPCFFKSIVLKLDYIKINSFYLNISWFDLKII